MSFSVRKQYDPSENPEVRAIRWNPGDPLETGHLVGWLMASGAGFCHPSGIGDTTTLAIKTPDGEILAEPGDWTAGTAQEGPAR